MAHSVAPSLWNCGQRAQSSNAAGAGLTLLQRRPIRVFPFLSLITPCLRLLSSSEVPTTSACVPDPALPQAAALLAFPPRMQHAVRVPDLPPGLLLLLRPNAAGSYTQLKRLPCYDYPFPPPACGCCSTLMLHAATDT